jgi:adenosylcobinamide-GDP ribazoletransferase
MWRPLLCAVGFLTRLPVPHVELTERHVAQSAAFFSWVGGLIAGLLVLLSWALRGLGPELAALCLVACWALVTGGLHLDGVADSFDGLGGGRGDRTRMLEIMRDSRIGAHGAVALVLCLLFKWVALERVLTLQLSGWVLAPVLARWLATVLLAPFPYARQQGLGSAFAQRVSALHVGAGALALVPLGFLWGRALVVPALCGVLLALVLVLRMRKWLGGLTGDVHGAAIELCEIGVLLALGRLDLPLG